LLEPIISLAEVRRKFKQNLHNSTGDIRPYFSLTAALQNFKIQNPNFKETSIFNTQAERRSAAGVGFQHTASGIAHLTLEIQSFSPDQSFNFSIFVRP